jgi:hypothetical protein
MPVYWKPRVPTRVMRERAWAERSSAREQALKAQAVGRPSRWSRVSARLRRR